MHQHPTDTDDDRHGADASQLDHRKVPGRDAHGAEVGVELGTIVADEDLVLRLLAREGLDHSDARQALLQGRDRLAHAIAHREVGDVRVPAEADAGDDHHGHGCKTHRRQHGRENDENHDRGHEEQGVLDEHDEALLHERLEGVDVRGHPGDEPSRRLRVEERHAHGLEVIEDPHPQVSQEALTHPGDERDLGAAQHDRHGGRDEVADHGEVEDQGVVGLQAAVDAQPHHQRAGEHRQGVHDEDDQGDRHLAPVGPQHAQRPPDDLSRLARRQLLLVSHRAGPPAHHRTRASLSCCGVVEPASSRADCASSLR